MEEGIAIHSSILPGKSYGQRNLVDYSPWVVKSGTWLRNLHFHFFLFILFADSLPATLAAHFFSDLLDTVPLQGSPLTVSSAWNTLT